MIKQAICVFFGTATLALAHGAATGIVRDRMDGMVAMGKAMKAISVALQEAPANAEDIRAGAAQVKSHAGQNMTNLFPEGELTHSEARPEIWEDWEKFAKLAERLAIQAEGLLLAAKNQKTGARPGSAATLALEDYAQMGPDEVFKHIGQTCGACHKDFRLKK